MKAKELITLLKQVDGELEVFLSSDAEMNWVAPIDEAYAEIIRDTDCIIIMPSHRKMRP
jgi:hypothetical protein